MRVLVFGTFDRLHPGHRFLLAEASQRGEVTVVIARDVTVTHIKGHAPHQNESERLRSVQQAFPLAHVMLGHVSDYSEPVRRVQPELIIMGYDQALPPGVIAGDFPCRVERLPAFEPHHYKSSKMRK